MKKDNLKSEISINDANIGFIGAGKMAEAIIRAISSKRKGVKIYASDINADRLNYLAKETGTVAATTESILGLCRIIFLAVKPQDFANVSFHSGSVKQLDDAIIVSIMAGVKIGSISQKTGSRKVVRVMPNLCASVSESCSAYAYSAGVAEDEIGLVHDLLETFGTARKVSEEQLDAVTGVSGSGPAYVAYLIDALSKAAVSNGLDEKTAMALSIQTFYGTAKLLKEKGIQPKELISSVSSKGGTTIAAMSVLDSSDCSVVIENAVQKAAMRSRELSR